MSCFSFKNKLPIVLLLSFYIFQSVSYYRYCGDLFSPRYDRSRIVRVVAASSESSPRLYALHTDTVVSSSLTEGSQSSPLPSLAANVASVSSEKSEANQKAIIDLWYDSGCPICNMEAEFLKKRDVNRIIRFTDISDPNQRGKVRYVEGMKRLRVRLPDKRIVIGREVFRHAYQAIGLAWVYLLTRLPVLSEVVDVVYDSLTETQLRLNGQVELAEQYKKEAEKLKALQISNVDPFADPSSTSFFDGQIDLLYDSECPICNMEVAFLKKRDIYQRIRFTDISAPDYDPKQHGNIQYVDGMKKLRAVLPDNRVITGVEVFRYTYDAIGLGWVFAATKWPGIGQLADAVYDIWAENRLRITGRHDLAEKLKAQTEILRNMELEECDNSCDLEEE